MDTLTPTAKINNINKEDKLNSKLEKTSSTLEETLNENLLYQKDPLNEIDINNIETTLEELNLKEKLQKKAKTFIRIVREIAQNTFDHSLKKQPKLSIKENIKGKYFSIKTSNYFDGGETNKEKLIETFEKINNSDATTIKEAYMEALDNGEDNKSNGFSGAGLGLLDIARKIKKMVKGKIFNYNIKEEKDKNDHTIYKLDLETKFPMSGMGLAA